MKKGNNSKMGNQIFFKIAGYLDLAVLIIFYPVITQKPSVLPYVLFLVTTAMLIGARHHRTNLSN
jgi:hypothetical protein